MSEVKAVAAGQQAGMRKPSDGSGGPPNPITSKAAPTGSLNTTYLDPTATEARTCLLQVLRRGNKARGREVLLHRLVDSVVNYDLELSTHLAWDCTCRHGGRIPGGACSKRGPHVWETCDEYLGSLAVRSTGLLNFCISQAIGTLAYQSRVKDAVTGRFGKGFV